MGSGFGDAETVVTRWMRFRCMAKVMASDGRVMASDGKVMASDGKVMASDGTAITFVIGCHFTNSYPISKLLYAK